MERKRASLLSWTNKYSDSGLYKRINISIILLEDIRVGTKTGDALHPNTMQEESLFSRFRRASISSHVARNSLKLGHGIDVQNWILASLHEWMILRLIGIAKSWQNACIQSCQSLQNFMNWHIKINAVNVLWNKILFEYMRNVKSVFSDYRFSGLWIKKYMYIIFKNSGFLSLFYLSAISTHFFDRWMNY